MQPHTCILKDKQTYMQINHKQPLLPLLGLREGLIIEEIT